MATRQNSTNGKPKSPRIQVVLPELICKQLTILADNDLSFNKYNEQNVA